MSRMVKIALGQEPNGWPKEASPAEVRRHHHRQMESLVEQATAENADIICFCENAPGHGVDAFSKDLTAYEDVLDGPDYQWASRQAAEHGINLILPTVGYHHGKFQNVAILFDRKGTMIGVYEKVHLTKGERDSGQVNGATWPVFDLDFGRIGIMICHDMHFPESARCLALNGAEIIFWPTHYAGLWGDDYVISLMRATAIHNGVYLATVSLGPEPDTPWVSNGAFARSGVIGPRGEWRFSAGFAPGLTTGRIDLAEPLDRPHFSATIDDNYREMFIADRRPDTYGRLLER